MPIVKRYFDVHGKLRTKVVSEKKIKVNWMTFRKDSSYTINYNRLKRMLNCFSMNIKQQRNEDVTVCFSPTQINNKILDITRPDKTILRLGSPREFQDTWWANQLKKGVAVGWYCGTDSWAYRIVADNITKNLKFPVSLNAPRDVNVLSNPQSTQKFNEFSNIIVRLDAVRAYDRNNQLYGKITTGGNMWEDTLSKCGALVATNMELYNYAKGINENTFLITNGLDLSRFRYIYRITPKETFTVGFVGSVGRPEYRAHKGYDLVIKACEITGSELNEALYKQKQVPHDQMIDKFYSNVDCIVHPTLSEGSSNVCMEALALGIPLITTRTCGFHGERLTEGENVLFCERTVESVAGCIERLKRNVMLRLKLSHNGRRFAEQNHDIREIASKWDEVIRFVSSKTKGE